VTAATLLAGLAGALAAGGLADLAAVVSARRAAVAPGPPGPARVPGPASSWGAALARLGRRVGAPAAPGDLGARLAAAGVGPSVGVADVMAAKAGGAVVAALLAAPVLATLPPRLLLVVLPACAAAGFLAPDLWLRRRAQRRAERAGLELADVLDLLRVAIEAGLPVGRALAEVGRRRGGLVAAELRGVAARLELGAGRADALAHLHRRLPLGPIATLGAAVARADRHGAPLGPALAALAQEARADRARQLHEQAAGAAPRIQLVVALLLVPAVLLLVAAGLVHGLA
jgi:tight adherence protein C